MTTDLSSASILTFRHPVAPELAEPPEIDRELPGQATLHLDREVPFLCVYRAPPGAGGGVVGLISGESAQLMSGGDSVDHRELSRFLLDTVSALSPRFGGFLLLEVWLGPPCEDGRPVARIVEQPERAPRSTIDHLGDAFREARLRDQEVSVENVISALPAPPGLPPLLDESTLRRQGCALVGVELSSVITEQAEKHATPRLEGEPIRNALRRGLADFALGAELRREGKTRGGSVPGYVTDEQRSHRGAVRCQVSIRGLTWGRLVPTRRSSGS